MKRICNKDETHQPQSSMKRNGNQNCLSSTKGPGQTPEVNSPENHKDQRTHDWEWEKLRGQDFYDEGSMSTFWQAHTVTVLVLFLSVLLYVCVFETDTYPVEYNIKRGIGAVALAFLLVGVLHSPDGPFRRPHPAFWRFILCASWLYELCLIFVLFQNVDDARQLLTFIDADLGKPLPEKDYGGNCLIYDPNNVTDPFHNVKDKMDGFVVVHFFGWWLKTLILRDFWLCNVLSFMFEVLEYTLEHQLPNFSECWWDHWIMDFLGCNLAGIWLGMVTLRYLRMKPYRWQSMWNIRGYRGKLKRIALQFTPYKWMDFDWKVTGSLKRWLFTLMTICFFLLAELNTFYLKFVLWVPPPHFLCLGRLVFFLFMGATAMREAYQFLDDPMCNRLGRQGWLIAAIIITEFFIVLKFDWETVTKPLPTHVMLIWSIGLLTLVLWTVWHFFVKRWIVKHHQATMTVTEKAKDS